MDIELKLVTLALILKSFGVISNLGAWRRPSWIKKCHRVKFGTSSKIYLKPDEYISINKKKKIMLYFHLKWRSPQPISCMQWKPTGSFCGAAFVIAGGTAGCNNASIRCRQWQRGWHRGSSRVWEWHPKWRDLFITVIKNPYLYYQRSYWRRFDISFKGQWASFIFLPYFICITYVLHTSYHYVDVSYLLWFYSQHVLYKMLCQKLRKRYSH